MPSPPSRSRRLLLVIHSLPAYGGAEHQLEHLARGLSSIGHDVTICCIDGVGRDVGRLEADGVKIVCLNAAGRLQRVRAVVPLAKLARGMDVVLCSMWDASLWGRIASILARRPVIVADHATDRSVQVASSGADRGSWIALHNRLLDRFTAATVACATSQIPTLRSEGVAADKIAYIPNGVPVAEIEAEAERAPSREELGIPGVGRLVLHVGVFRPEKNQLGTLMAFERLRARLSDVQVVFVGDGQMRPEVEGIAHELGATWAHFVGFRDDVAPLLHHAELMVLPSTSDAMPMTVLEAMAVGVPVVASDVGDIRRTLGGGGICVPAGDSSQFERACADVLTNDALRGDLSEAGQENARRFDSAEMAARYSELFESVCDDERGSAHRAISATVTSSGS